MKTVKNVIKTAIEPNTQVCWDEIQDDFHISEESASDGTRKIISQKIKKQVTEDHLDREYPEIIWYLISKYVKPEDIGTFARINKSAYSVTKTKAFWMSLYKRYCENHPKLPEKLYTDSFKTYGLRQTVIRALYHTYEVFVTRIARMATQDSRPHLLVNRKCVNVWFSKGIMYWSVYFKLKRPLLEKQEFNGLNFIEQLGRIDANPEEHTQILKVTCKRPQEVPPLMGMTLSSVTMSLAQGFRHHKLTLGFNSSPYVAKGVLPECSVILDAVISAFVCDWWHPLYAHGGVLVPREHAPLLQRNFFDDCS